MIHFEVPGIGDYNLEHLVMDVNGTLAVDGQLIAGVQTKIASLREQLSIHLLTADTHGRQAFIDEELGLLLFESCQGMSPLKKPIMSGSWAATKLLRLGKVRMMPVCSPLRSLAFA